MPADYNIKYYLSDLNSITDLPLHPFGGIGKKNLTQAVIYDLLYLTVQIFFNLVNQGCTEW